MLIMTCTIMAVMGFLEGIADRQMYECGIRWWVRMACFMITLVMGVAICCGLMTFMGER